MKYELLRAKSVSNLNAFVQEKLNAGWTLYGDPIIDANSDSSVYAQAVILIDIKDPEHQKYGECPSCGFKRFVLI